MRVRGYRVFYIDEESGIKDLIELIQKTTAVRMALVVKNSQLILNSTVNLKLLKNYGKKYKKELVFINPDPVIVDKVIKAGFQIYENLNTLERNLPLSAVKATDSIAVGSEDNHSDSEEADKHFFSNKKRDNGKSPKGKRIFFTPYFSIFLFLLILGLAYFYFFYPTATVEVRPVIRTASQELSVLGSINHNRIDWQNNILPIRQTQVEISGEEEIRTSAYKLIGDRPARGIVRFINELQEDIQIPVGTILLADNGLEYRTTEDLIVPATQVDYLMNVPVGMRAGQAEVEVESLTPGSKGNINIGQITGLAGEPVVDIHVINPEPISGGTDKQIALVSEKDLEKGAEILAEELKSRLFSRIYQELGGNYRIIEDTVRYSDERYEFSHQVGAETDSLTVKGSILASGYLIKNNELDRLLTRIFQDNLSENLQLMSSGINIDFIQLEERDNNLYNIKIRVNAPVMTIIDSDRLARNLLGLDMVEAQDVLEEISDIEDYRIESQASRLPNMGFAIKVVVTEPEEMKVFNLNE